jgi:hypothetical protein
MKYDDIKIVLLDIKPRKCVDFFFLGKYDQDFCFCVCPKVFGRTIDYLLNFYQSSILNNTFSGNESFLKHKGWVKGYSTPIPTEK